MAGSFDKSMRAKIHALFSGSATVSTLSATNKFTAVDNNEKK